MNNSMEPKENVSMKDYTTFKIGGRATYFFEIENEKDLKTAIDFSSDKSLPFFILGNGSNLLVSDNGFDGVVIKISGSDVFKEDNSIYAQAGVLLSSLVRFAFGESVSGFEWAAGIPGTVGGAIRGNAGAFDSSMADIVKEVDVFDLKEKKLITIENRDCDFDYRSSLFKKNGSLVILSAKMKITKGEQKEIKKRIDDNLDYRKEKHPSEPSAGSVFKGVTLSEVDRKKIVQKWPDVERFDDMIPAAFLIDKCGLKGEVSGQAMISKKHPNFIINTGEATAKDVLNLIGVVKERVKDLCDISLEEEISYLGF